MGRINKPSISNHWKIFGVIVSILFLEGILYYITPKESKSSWHLVGKYQLIGLMGYVTYLIQFKYLWSRISLVIDDAIKNSKPSLWRYFLKSFRVLYLISGTLNLMPTLLGEIFGMNLPSKLPQLNLKKGPTLLVFIAFASWGMLWFQSAAMRKKFQNEILLIAFQYSFIGSCFLFAKESTTRFL